MLSELAGAFEAELCAESAERRQRLELRHGARDAARALRDDLGLVAAAWPGRTAAELEAIAAAQAALPAGLEHAPPGYAGIAMLIADLAPRCEAALFSPLHASAELARLCESNPDYGLSVLIGACGMRPGGSTRRTLDNPGSGGWRARSIVVLGVVVAEADRLGLRPSQCTFARLLSAPRGRYSTCRACDHEHISLHTLSHWDRHGLDTLDGQIGYLQALWLAGALDWHQWRHPLGIERYCRRHEIGRSGWPTNHYTVTGVATGLDLTMSPADIVQRAAAIDRARLVLEHRIGERVRLALGAVERSQAPP